MMIPSCKKPGVFITGTDTNVGKTIISSMIVSALKSHGMPAGYFKPVQTGMDLDCDTVRDLSGLSSEWVERPVYAFPEPIAPHRAAQMHQREISTDQIQKRWDSLTQRMWVVEGAGGLLVPLNHRASIRELIMALNLPLIVVASTRLGTINHTLLTLESASRAGLVALGIVLVGDEDPGLAEVFNDITDTPVLAQIPYLHSLSTSHIREVALEKFPAHQLRELYDSV